jgi:hypothetical protein
LFKKAICKTRNKYFRSDIIDVQNWRVCELLKCILAIRMSTLVKAEVRSTKAVTGVRMRKKKPAISNTGKFFCFNNNASNLYNNSVVEQIYGMAYVFTLLMFRKPNKTTINKNKTTIFYRSTSFRFSFIFRYFKVFQVSEIFTCRLSDFYYNRKDVDR